MPDIFTRVSGNRESAYRATSLVSIKAVALVASTMSAAALRSRVVCWQKRGLYVEVVFVAKAVVSGLVLALARGFMLGFVHGQRAGGRHRGDSVTVQMNEFHGVQAPDVKGMSVRSYATDTPSVLDLRDFACARW